MIERFLEYSLKNARPIYIMVLANGALRRVRAVVTAFDECSIQYARGGGREGASILRADVLSAGYVRGDNGETPIFKQEDKP